MAYSIKLTFQAPEPANFRGQPVFRLACAASEPIGMPSEIFAHQRTLVDPIDGTQQDEFSFICSPYELSIFPANEPDAEQSPQYFRKDETDFLLPSVTMFSEVKDSIVSQVSHLIDLMNSLDTLNVVDEIYIPADSAPEDSSSVS